MIKKIINSIIKSSLLIFIEGLALEERWLLVQISTLAYKRTISKTVT